MEVIFLVILVVLLGVVSTILYLNLKEIFKYRAHFHNILKTTKSKHFLNDYVGEFRTTTLREKSSSQIVALNNS